MVRNILIILPLLMLLGAAPTSDLPPVDLNTATVEQLMQLPGVGHKRATDIVSFRRLRPFRRPRDLLRVRGIALRTYMKIKPYITVTRPEK